MSTSSIVEESQPSRPDRRLLHVALLLTQSLDSPSGLGRYGPLARNLVRRGHQVEIYALHPNYSASISQPIFQDGVRVEYIAPMHVRKEGSRKSYYRPLDLLKVTALATWRLSQSALKTHAPVLHICKPHPMNGAAGLGGMWLRKKMLFVDCDDYEAGSNLFGAGWQRAIVANFERLIPRRAAAVTTNTHFMRRKLEEWGVRADKISYLPNGVERERFRPPPHAQVQALRSQLGIVGMKVVAYIGSLSLTNHPVNLLLEAFTIVRESMPDTVLLVVGGGENYESLKNLAAITVGRHAIFTGRVSPEEVAAYYHLADVTVDPVRDDEAARGRSPLKMFESWACGVPFVTADVGDRVALMGSPPAGTAARPGDPSALADAILQILRSPQFAETLRLYGEERVQAYYWDVLAAELEQFYYRYV